mmetsp:Transcript_48897/g.98383  ORF Transcript_48897/g.98383 Transcript_48897/m.98383 type:complete len:217 (+) Transcript_48897:45-695(+)
MHQRDVKGKVRSLSKDKMDHTDGRAMADRIKCCGRTLPRYLWYMLSGAICDIFQFLFDGVFSSLMTDTITYERDTVAWTVAYVMTISLRHETHRIFVFGAYEGSYWLNLGKMYATYATTIVASIFLRAALARAAEGLPADLLAILSARTCAYLGTVLFTGVFSYFALKKSWGGKLGGGVASSTAKPPIPKGSAPALSSNADKSTVLPLYTKVHEGN